MLSVSIREQIHQHLQPLLQAGQMSAIELSVEDESFRHGRIDSHFKVIAVAEFFMTMSPIQRHRWLYLQLDPWLKAGVHALALHLFTPEEQTKMQNTASPMCRGGERLNETREEK